MSRRAPIALSALFILTCLVGCGPEETGVIEGQRLFGPLLGSGRAHLTLVLKERAGSSAIKVEYLDFSGRRVGIEFIPLPAQEAMWGGLMGRGVKWRNRPYHALRVSLLGKKAEPLKYRFQPVAGANSPKTGFYGKNQ